MLPGCPFTGLHQVSVQASGSVNTGNVIDDRAGKAALLVDIRPEVRFKG